MKNNINLTFNALNSHYLDTNDMTINEAYLCDAITMWVMNTERLYKATRQNSQKLTSIVWEAFADLTNDHIKCESYPYNQDCRCTSYQLKKWLNQYGHGYDTLKLAVEDLSAEKEEALAETNK